MRVMVIVKATDSSESGVLPSKQLMQQMAEFNEQLIRAGVMKSGDGLKPSSAGVRVQFSGDSRTVVDGPFTETKELIAGYWVWEVESIAEAIDWVKRCPNPMPEDSEIEIRPFYEMSDFAEIDPTGEMAQQEKMFANALATQTSGVTPYLFFGGNCEEALAFYQQALGAKVDMVLKYSDSPEPVPEGRLQPGFENKVMHASFHVGRSLIMCSDGCDDQSKSQGFRLSLDFASSDDARKVFGPLSEGGVVDMPLTKTFWSSLFGMVTDRFGVGWMISVAEQPTK